MLKWFVVSILLLFVPAVHAQTDALELHTLIVDDLERSYALHLPPELVDPMPLVLVLHGRFGTGIDIARYTGFNDLADRENFIVAYPDGLEGEWNYPRGVQGYPDTHDDLAFLTALVDDLAADYPIDLTRVYIAGFSNGGFMAERAACENPARFAAFASVAAAGFGGMLDVCLEAGTVTAPILMVHGTADENIPWAGTGVTRGERTVYVTYPVPDTLGFWAGFNGCSDGLDTVDLPQSDDSLATSIRIFTVDCPEDAAVVLYGLIGGVHEWPRPLSADSTDIDTTEIVWQFFAPRTRPQES